MNALVPADLVDAVAGGRAIAFIGSGLSLAARLPDWPGLLRDLADHALANGLIGVPQQQELRDWSTKSDFLMLADAVANILTRARFTDYMKRRFDGDFSPTDAHRAIAAMPFAAFLTTNYDRLLEKAWAKPEDPIRTFTHADEEELRDPFQSRRPFLVKIHGDIVRPATLILGLGEFRGAIHGNRAYRMFLQDVFRRYTVLFLGYSLSDPDILNILDELVAIFDTVPGRHYALVDRNRMSPMRAGVFDRNYGIQSLIYEPTAPNHPEVLTFLRELAQAVQDQVQQQLQSLRIRLNQDLKDPHVSDLRDILSQFLPVDVAAPFHDPPPPLFPPAFTVRAPAPLIAPSVRAPLPLVPPSPHVPQSQARGLRDYWMANMGAAGWGQLEKWYEALRQTPAGQLLRTNLDRESWRTDVDAQLWQKFLRQLLEAGPSPERPFQALLHVLEYGKDTFLLRGKKLEYRGNLYRHVRLANFLRAAKEAGISASDPASLTASDPRMFQIAQMLLGSPGGPVWCTEGSFIEQKSASDIGRILWDKLAVSEPVLEIRYSGDSLAPDEFLRVPSVMDIYNTGVENANVLKPEADSVSPWCSVIWTADAPNWKPLAKAAVHPALNLATAGARTIGLRVVV